MLSLVQVLILVTFVTVCWWNNSYFFSVASAVTGRYYARYDTQARSHYRFEPLKPREIRLFQVGMRRSLNDVVRCSLTHVSLDDEHRGDYMVLAHERSGSKTASIICNGEYLPVTEALFNTLQRLGPSPDIKVWAYGVGVDDSNLAEKAYHLLLLPEILGAAMAVMGDLGERHSLPQDKLPISRIGMEFISKVEDYVRTPGVDDPFTAALLQMGSEKGYDVDQIWLGLVDIIDRPWFEGIEKLSESVLNPLFAWQVGVENIKIASLLTLTRELIARPHYWSKLASARPDIDRDRVLQILQSILTLHTAWNANRAAGNNLGHYITLIEGMRLSSHSTSHDNDHDDVYGLIPLLNPSTVKDLAPCYKKPIDQMYTETATIMIRESGLSAVLALRSRASNAKTMIPSFITGPRNCGAPSWTPDFYSSDAYAYSLLFRSQHALKTYGKPLFTAGGTKVSHAVLSPESPSILQISGYSVDKIAAIHILGGADGGLWLPGDIMEHHPGFKKYLADEMYRQVTPNIPQKEALWRVFVANSTPDNKRAPASLGALIDTPDEIPAYDITTRNIIYDEGLVNGGYGPEENGNLNLALYMAGIRAICFTEKGYLASVPEKAKEGDAIVVFDGVDVPFVLRMAKTKRAKKVVDGSGEWKIVGNGEAYVHGLMDGEAVNIGLPMVFSVV